MGRPTRWINAAILIASTSVAACAPNPERSPTAGSSADALTTARVQAALAAQNLDVTDIRVDTFGSVVRLTGFAWDRQSADRAEAAARRVSGVTDVKNEIVLRGGGRQSF